MTIGYRKDKTRPTIEVTPDEWAEMQKKDLAKNFYVIDAKSTMIPTSETPKYIQMIEGKKAEKNVSKLTKDKSVK